MTAATQVSLQNWCHTRLDIRETAPIFAKIREIRIDSLLMAPLEALEYPAIFAASFSLNLIPQAMVLRDSMTSAFTFSLPYA